MLYFCPDKSSDLAPYAHTFYNFSSAPLAHSLAFESVILPPLQNLELDNTKTRTVIGRIKKSEELDKRKDRIFELFHQGKSIKQIARTFSQESFKVSDRTIARWMRKNIPFYIPKLSRRSIKATQTFSSNGNPVGNNDGQLTILSNMASLMLNDPTPTQTTATMPKEEAVVQRIQARL